MTYEAVEAVCRAGQIVPLETVHFDENERLMIVRLPALSALPAETPSGAADWRRHVGVLRNSPHWQGDPMDVQAALRYEWD